MLDAIAYLASLHDFKESKFERMTQKMLDDLVDNIEVVDPVFVESKKKPSKDTLKPKKEKNGHGRNFTIDDEEEDEELLDWKDILHFEMLDQEEYNKDPFKGFVTTIS
jgi:hypothetical protein